jgi:inner membrane transporter RhtA
MWRPIAMVCCSVLSLQAGTAIATTAFGSAGPVGAVWVRSVVGGGLLALYIRPKIRAFTREQIAAVVPFGLCLVGLNVFFFLALDRAPLGIVSGIEMLGPLAIAVFGRRDSFDFVWIALAGAGVLLLCLTRGTGGRVDTLGLVFALCAAAAWGTYIVLGKRVGQRVEGLGGLALALLISAAVQTPLGLVFHKSGLWSWSVLGVLAASGVLATLLPFALEMTALRALSIGTFGLLMALEPASATFFGFAIRGQHLASLQLVGVGLVILGAAGVLGPRWTRPGSYARLMRSDDPRVRFLARIPLFDGLNLTEIETVAGLMKEQELPAGHVLMRQGEPGDEFFVVESGAVEITMDGRVVATRGAGDFFGEIALVFGGPRIATATAKDDVRLFALDKTDFDKMLKSHPKVEGKILTAITERIRYR